MARPFRLILRDLTRRLESDQMYTILCSMDSRNLTKRQAAQLLEDIRPMKAYLQRLQVRMIERAFRRAILFCNWSAQLTMGCAIYLRRSIICPAVEESDGQGRVRTMKIERLAFVAFPVADLNRSRVFYVHVLGA